MRARDVMVTSVITVKPNLSVREAAKIFLERRISAVPVVDEQGKLVGIELIQYLHLPLRLHDGRYINADVSQK
jgi:CBS domain-containing protein